MVTITVSSGAPSDIAPGAYYVTLVGLEGPRTIYPQSGPNAGKEVEVLDWKFALDNGDPLDGTTSTSSGPKSKLYAWLTALLGTPPAAGTRLEADQIIGCKAIATVEVTEGGWPRIANLSAMPAAPAPAPQPVQQAPRQAPQPQPQQPAAKAAPRQAPAPVAVAPSGDLPF